MAEVTTSHRFYTAAAILLMGATVGFGIFSGGAWSAKPADDPLALLTAAKLTDQHGNRVTRKDLDNKLVVANFFFTSCGNACPLQTTVLNNVQNQLDASVDVVFLSVSIAPMIDSADAIDGYIEKHQLDHADWRFVTTSVEHTETLVKQFGVTMDNMIVENDQIDHRNMGYLFGKRGRLMQQYQLVPGVVDRLVREVSELDKLHSPQKTS